MRNEVQAQVQNRHGRDYPAQFIDGQINLWHNPYKSITILQGIDKALMGRSRFVDPVRECGRGQRPPGASHIRKANRKSSRSRALKSE
jgi:hypothetical protein